MISYKYPLFPEKITQQKLAEALDACRWLYNNFEKNRFTLLNTQIRERENGVKDVSAKWLKVSLALKKKDQAHDLDFLMLSKAKNILHNPPCNFRTFELKNIFINLHVSKDQDRDSCLWTGDAALTFTCFSQM
jgi:hypothetical protein